MTKIFLTTIIAAAIFVSCNNSNTKTTSTNQPLVVATADATEKYQCPMKCQGDTAYTTAGKCPVCEMDLEKLK
jgi:hypothetical protein